MFTHLNIEFDLGGDKITAETAAKDYHGVPIYQYIYDTAEKSAVEITNVDDEGIKEASVEVPKAVIVAPQSISGQVSVEEESDAAVAEAASEDGDLFLVNNVLTLEEQREVAIKVVSFFVMLIVASFVLLYIYHRCSQKKTLSQRDKKTL